MKLRCKPVCYFFTIALLAILLTLLNGYTVLADPPIMFDFGTYSSPLEPGYNRVYWNTAYTPGSYGWLNTYDMEDGDRGAPADNLKRDFCYSTGPSTFRVDNIPNGTYLLEYMMGDAWYAHDNMKIAVNGVTVSGINSPLNQFVTGEMRVIVSTGYLQIEFSDMGGIDPCWVINSIVLRRNIAPQATATASSTFPGYPPYGAVDGIISGYPYNYYEWASNGETVGAWLRLTWSTAKTIKKVRIYDRINGNDWILAWTCCWNSFAYATEIPLENMPGNPAKLDTTLIRPSTWLQFSVDDVSEYTFAAGLAEIEVYE